MAITRRGAFLVGLLGGATVLQAPARAQEDAPAPEWGLTAVSILTVPAPSFGPSSGTVPYSLDSNGAFCLSGSSGPCTFDAGFHLPSGARIIGVQLEACDSSAIGSATVDLRRCPVNTGTCSNQATVTTGAAALPGCTTVDSAALNLTVDNANDYYALRATVVFDGTVTNQYFKAARIRYQLQVSPPPGTATFGDVPIGHPQRQFIEAVAAAGITSGCNPGPPPLYCPDNFVTRGQMAVFLARLVGLHFPN